MNRLTDLVVKKVTLVAAGANPDADILLYKAEDDMAELPKDVADRIAALETNAAGTDEKVKKSIVEVLKSIFTGEKKDEPKVDAEIAKRDEVIAKLNDRVTQLADERERDTYIAKAQSLGLPGDDWGTLLRKAEKDMTAEERKTFGEKLAGLAKIAKDSVLFREVGGNGAGEGDTWGKIEKLADGIVAKSSGAVSKQQAIADALKTPEGKALYTEYLKEQTKGAA